MARRDEIQEIKAANPIEDVIGERIDLKKEGQKYRGLCPFHDDTDPSLVVSPDKGLWNCFGCPKTNGKTGGDVVDFVVRYDRVSFRDAIESLRNRGGLPRPGSENAPAAPGGNGKGARKSEPKTEPPVEVSIARRKKLLGRVAAVYHKSFLLSEKAQDYLWRKRGLRLESLGPRHQIGFASGKSLKDLIPEGAEVARELEALGVLSEKGQERFRQRVVFPLTDEDGEVVGLVGRRMDGLRPRHMALSGPFMGLFNRSCLASHDWVILVEGVIDALSVESVGYANAIPLLGKTVRKELLDAIRSSGVGQVVVMLDGGAEDDAAAIEAVLSKEIPEVDVRIAKLCSDGSDPNTYVVFHPPETLREVIEKARGKTREGAQGALRASPGEDGAHEIRFENRSYVIRAIEKRGEMKLRVNLKADAGTHFHLHTVNLYNARERKEYAREAAALFHVEYTVTSRDLMRILERVEALLAKREKEARRPKAAQVSKGLREEALALGRSKNVLEEVVQDARKLGIVGEEANLLAMYLLVTSRKMTDPLSILFLSGSGAGKSLLQDRILSLCPEEDLILVTALTGRSLFYREESLRGKVLAVREETGAEKAGYAIRALISDKELVVEATIKDPVTGRLTTMTNRVEGPPAVSVTSASPKIDPETAGRFLVLSVDETSEQTERILEHQRQAETLEGILARRERERIVARHRVFQSLLAPVEVVNPYAAHLTYPVKGLRARRSQPMYLALIRTVAFLNQMKKRTKNLEHLGETVEYVEVDLEDIAAAHRLAHELLGGTIEDLSSVGRQLLDEIEELVAGKEKEAQVPRHELLFSRRDVREATGKSDFQVRTYLDELVSLEYVIPVQRGARGRTLYRLDYRGEGGRRSRFVVGLVELEELGREIRGSA